MAPEKLDRFARCFIVLIILTCDVIYATSATDFGGGQNIISSRRYLDPEQQGEYFFGCAANTKEIFETIKKQRNNPEDPFVLAAKKIINKLEAIDLNTLNESQVNDAVKQCYDDEMVLGWFVKPELIEVLTKFPRKHLK